MIETKRLRMRPFEGRDGAFLFKLNQDPEVMRYLGPDNFGSEEAAVAFAEHNEHFREHGYARWLVELKENGMPIGWCGLLQVTDNAGHGITEPFIDLGYRFLRSSWGNGYATESAYASMVHGFDELHLGTIQGRAMPENAASVRVLEKMGMQAFWEGPCDMHYAVYFRVTRPEFEPVRRALEAQVSPRFK